MPLWLLGAAWAACAHPTGSPAPVIEPRSQTECLNGRVVPPEEVKPARVRVVNEAAFDLRVVIDQCFQHLFLGTVKAGSSGGFRLPSRLVEFPEGLRFHVFSVVPLERYGTFALKLAAPLSGLVLSDNTPRVTYDVPEGLPSPRRWLGAVSTYVGDDRAYASAFANGTSAVVSWQCLGEQPFLVFTAARRLGPSPEVVASAPGSLGRSFGVWEVVRSVSDVAVAPPGAIGPFTRFALGVSHATLHASTEEEVPQGHQFTLRGLEAALRELPCFASFELGTMKEGLGLPLPRDRQ